MIEGGEKFEPTPGDKPMHDVPALALRAEQIKGRRNGGRQWSRAILQALDEAGITDQPERNGVYLQLVDYIGFERGVALSPSQRQRADEGIERDWVRRTYD